MSVPKLGTGRRAWMQAILAVGLLVGGTLAAFTPAYQQNDDVVMAMIASGRGVSLEPDAHLVYVNVLLGEFLRQGYRWAPRVPWYGLLLIGAQAGAQVALLRALLTRRNGIPWLFLPYYAAVSSAFVVRLQFTAVAGLTAGAGVALWMAALDREPDGAGTPRGATGLLVPAALVLLGSLLRFQALLLVLVVALPLAVAHLVRVGRRRMLRAVGGLATVLLLALALHLGDRAWYQREPGWREFAELNSLCTWIIDYAAGHGDPQGPELGPRLGWTANDALMLRRFFYVDRTVFPTEKLRVLVEATPVAAPDTADAWESLREVLGYPSLLPMALVLPLLVACGSIRDRLRVLGLTLVPAVVVVASLAVLLRAPEHVAMPALAFTPTALLLVRDAGRRRPRGWWWLALALGAAAGGLAVRQCRASSATAAKDNSDLRDSLALLSPQPGQLYVEWAGAFSYEAVLPLEDTSYLDGLSLYALGWPQRSPIADRMLKAHGVDDLFRSLYQRPDLFLLMNYPWRDSLEVYARERYGIPLRIATRARTPSFTVFQLEPADTPVPVSGVAHSVVTAGPAGPAR